MFPCKQIRMKTPFDQYQAIHGNNLQCFSDVFLYFFTKVTCYLSSFYANESPMSRNIRVLPFRQALGLCRRTPGGNFKVKSFAAKTTVMKALLAFALIYSGQSAWSYSVSGTTYTTTGSSSDVQAAVNAAPSGGTIVFSPGTYSWSNTTPVLVNKSVTLTATPGTVQIQNQLGAGSGFMMQLTSGTDGHIRVNGINFLQVGNNISSSSSCCLGIDRTDNNGPGSPGTQYTVIFTNCKFDSGTVFNYMGFSSANGIIFSGCTFTNQMSSLGLTGISFTCAKYGPTKTWNTPDTMGLGPDSTGLNVGDTAAGWDGVAGLNCTYVENCTISNGTSGSFNGDDNSRVVIRHCIINDSQIFSHGQDTSQYGNRHYEIYNNTYHYVSATVNDQCWASFRGAVALVANNVMDAIPGKTAVILECQQINRSAGPGGCQTAYPANRQCGIGWSAKSTATYGHPVVTSDGQGQVSDPCYIWGNTGSGASGTSYAGLSQFTPDECGNGLQVGQFIQLGRDYFVGTARPGWVPYTYPHPLVAAGAPAGNPAGTPAAPLNLRVE